MGCKPYLPVLVEASLLAYNSFIEPWLSTIHRGSKHLYDPAEMKVFCDQQAPGLFGQLYKSILNDEKE